jgi:ADP-ribose pyrophosphatase YjhB (NUDIX family)
MENETVILLRNQDVGLPAVDKFDIRKQRTAVRAVLLIGEKVVLMHFTKGGYFKLPGGGVEKYETSDDAVGREVLEETGYRTRIVKELSQIIEEQANDGYLQISDGYLVEQVGEPVEPALTDEETAAGATVFLADNLDQAIELVKRVPENPASNNLFRRARDGRYLQEVKDSLENVA